MKFSLDLLMKMSLKMLEKALVADFQFVNLELIKLLNFQVQFRGWHYAIRNQENLIIEEKGLDKIFKKIQTDFEVDLVGNNCLMLCQATVSLTPIEDIILPVSLRLEIPRHAVRIYSFCEEQKPSQRAIDECNGKSHLRLVH